MNKEYEQGWFSNASFKQLTDVIFFSVNGMLLCLARNARHQTFCY